VAIEGCLEYAHRSERPRPAGQLWHRYLKRQPPGESLFELLQSRDETGPFVAASPYAQCADNQLGIGTPANVARSMRPLPGSASCAPSRRSSESKPTAAALIERWLTWLSSSPQLSCKAGVSMAVWRWGADQSLLMWTREC